MSDFAKVTLDKNVICYISKYTITYMTSKEDGSTLICLSIPSKEETESITAKESIDKIILQFEG